MTSKTKYLQKIAGTQSKAVTQAKINIENRIWIKESKKIALKILIQLDELKWTQAYLAEELEVSPQYISKLLKGNDKFGFDILVKLQKVLSIPIFSDFEIFREISSNTKTDYGKLIKGNFGNNATKFKKINREAKIYPIGGNNDYVSLEDIKEN